MPLAVSRIQLIIISFVFVAVAAFALLLWRANRVAEQRRSERVLQQQENRLSP